MGICPTWVGCCLSRFWRVQSFPPPEGPAPSPPSARSACRLALRFWSSLGSTWNMRNMAHRDQWSGR
eukprot:822375-Prorocentrum_minimum.AAC.1